MIIYWHIPIRSIGLDDDDDDEDDDDDDDDGDDDDYDEILWRGDLTTVDSSRPEVHFLQDNLTRFTPILIMVMIIKDYPGLSRIIKDYDG